MGILDLQPPKTPLRHHPARALPHPIEVEDAAANEAVQLEWRRITSTRGRKTSLTHRIRRNQTQYTCSGARRACRRAKKRSEERRVGKECRFRWSRGE